MLSFKTIMALQVLSVLQSSDSRRLNNRELKAAIGLDNNGVAAALRALKREGWVDYGASGYYRLAIDPEGKTLYDLVLATEGVIQLGSRVCLLYWGRKAGTLCPGAVEADRALQERMAESLKSIRIGELIK